jgi:hypothetical protein
MPSAGKNLDESAILRLAGVALGTREVLEGKHLVVVVDL